MAGADIRRACVDILAIHLVGKQVQVVFFHQIAYLIHLTTRVKIARWVIGVADKNAFCTLVYQLFELLYLGQCKAFFNRCGDGSDGCTRRNGEGHIVSVSRFGNDNLVAGIQAGHKSKEHSLRTACGNDDIVGRYVYAEPLIISGELLSVRLIALRGRIFKYRSVDVFQGIKSHLRCRQVGLAYVQVINFRSSGFCRYG